MQQKGYAKEKNSETFLLFNILFINSATLAEKSLLFEEKTKIEREKTPIRTRWILLPFIGEKKR